jgi:amino acid adenylation domain-containing protein
MAKPNWTSAAMEEMRMRKRAVPNSEAECVPRLFEQRVRRKPDAVAIADSGGSMSYAELNASANRLAHLLVEQGVGPEDVVAVNLPCGRDLITTLLAILKAGAGYLPLDPGLPDARRSAMLEAAGVRLLLGSGAADSVPVLDPVKVDLTSHPDSDLAQTQALDDLAYLIFTSGSTGRPKAVAVTHRSLAHHARVITEAFALTPADRVLQFASPGFDVLGEEVYPTLVAGASIVVPLRPGTMTPPAELEELLRGAGVTVANLPSPYWDQWVQDLHADPRPVPETLRLLVVGSDAGHSRTLEEWWRHCQVPVHNAYGLTETTITATLQEFTPGEVPESDLLPIGRPLPGVVAYLLDDALAPVPDGAPGGLFIGGALLARGYQGQAALTAGRFLADPFSLDPEARMYCTGDRALRLPDGNLAFLGRSDDQVKIRGQRVEPGEISALLLNCPQVRQAHVRVLDDATGGRRLVAYAVADGTTVAELRDYCAAMLPAALVPSEFVLLEQLPLTPNGKIDQRALPLPEAVSPGAAEVPMPGMQEQIAAVWREVLRREQVGLDDSFFEIGGHSLLLVQVQRRLSQLLGRPIAGVTLFAYPTVRRLAAHLREDGDAPADNHGDERAGRRRDRQATLRQRRAPRNADGAR